jgi:RHS repeat-associated protein
MSNSWGVWVGYQYDTNGRLRQINAANLPDNVTTLGYDMTYRAFGAVKSMTFGDHQTLSTSYDNRMRPASWNVSNVLGFSYTYRGGYSDGGNNQVSYARNLSSNGGRDRTLDRSYEYDQVGALVMARSGAEARATFGIDGQQWGTSDGPYSHEYDYDKQGNMTLRSGWGGEVQGGSPGHETTIPYGYSNGKNQRDGLGYDAAGNLKDGESNQHYLYNAIGQQTNAWQVNGYSMAQGYDGDGLRGVKWESGVPTYYLRSSVLGGAVVAELDASGGFSRGYFYRGYQLLAVQQSNHMYWVHEDAITKSQRTTDVYGNVTSDGVVELDPWGANTARSSATVFQPQNFTSYTRDANGDQDAMARRYSVSGRFSQPDPYSGSYDFSDPQSLNRYAYVGNDPVNRTDPSGMMPNQCYDDYMRPIQCPSTGYDVVTVDHSEDGKLADYLFVLNSRFSGIGLGGNPLIPREPPKPVQTPKAPPVQPQKVITPKQSKEDCIASAIVHGLGRQALIGVKQIAIESGVGLGIAFTLFFGAEALAPEIEGGLLIGTLIRMDSLGRAAAFAGGAAYAAGKYAVNNYLDLYRNIGATARAVRACDG